MLIVLMCCFLLVGCSTNRSAFSDQPVTTEASYGFRKLVRWVNDLSQPVYYGLSIVPAGCAIDVYPYYCGDCTFVVVTTMEGTELVIPVEVSGNPEAN